MNLAQTKIDSLFALVEEGSRSLAESNAAQAQLAARLDDSQRMFTEFRHKCEEIEFEYEERLGDMHKRLTNQESLCDTYQSDLVKCKQQIGLLEAQLCEKTAELGEALHEIANERNEVSNLELVRKDLEAQRTFLTRELQDTDIKGKHCSLLSLLFGGMYVCRGGGRLGEAQK